MISFVLRGNLDQARRFLLTRQVFTLAESLGGVKSLICQPAGVTHASVEPARRLEISITDGLIRLSCGVEDVEDLIGDLEQAFPGALNGRWES